MEMGAGARSESALALDAAKDAMKGAYDAALRMRSRGRRRVWG